MRLKKKKLFLGAYLNFPNAQNFNCLSIALNIDKKKFDVMAIALNKFEEKKNTDIKILKVQSKFYRITNFFAFLIGVFWSDVSYLPKHHSTPKLILIISKLFNKKLFTTIEGNMCDRRFKSMIDSFGSCAKMKNYFKFIPNIYGITNYIINSAKCGVELNPNPLYLGVDFSKFSNVKKIRKLKNVVFIGSLIKRKRIFEIIEISQKITELNFHIIGTGSLQNEIVTSVSNKKNIFFHGYKSHNEIHSLLKIMDLNILLSHSEGFPKVILETAAASIPTIMYDSYGIGEIVQNNFNGYVLNNKTEILNKIKYLIKNPEELNKVSNNAYLLSKRFDWKIQIKNWEKLINEIYSK